MSARSLASHTSREGAEGPPRLKRGSTDISNDETEDSGSSYYLTDRLRPFIPYLDKPSSFWEAADLATRPKGHWTSIEVIRSWLNVCDLHHQGCRDRAFDNASPRSEPSWLVDVQRLCLVQSAPGMEYFALSYVWGQSPLICASKANVEELQGENSLLYQLTPLSRTIHDAIRLVASLGGKYLWVDCLCILQDDGPEKLRQLSCMADIYSHAVATIIAANGDDAESGLWGQFGPDQVDTLYNQTQNQSDFIPAQNTSIPVDAAPRPIDGDPMALNFLAGTDQQSSKRVLVEMDDSDQTYEEQISPIRSCYSPDGQLPDSPTGSSMVVEPNPQSNKGNVSRHRSERIMLHQTRQLIQSTWYDRGWTFQEQLFSPRKIIFQHQALNWECTHASRTALEGPMDLQVSIVDGVSLNTDEHQASNLGQPRSLLPDLHRFSRLVALYNRRQLTYPEDVLDAFAGVISRTSTQYAGGFITGLPQAFFVAALLWQPYHTITRRVSRMVPSEVACLPSWSWAGWLGTFNSESWRSAYGFMKGNPDEFYEKDDSVWQPSSWQTIPTVEYFRLDDSETKHPIHAIEHRYQSQGYAESDSPLPDGWSRHICPRSGKAFFRHSSDESREFWYPIPLPNANMPAPPHIHCKFLWFQTRRAFMRVGNRFVNRPTSRCLCTDLLDDTGKWAGVLRHPFKRMSAQANKLNRLHELIELSAGAVLHQETEEVSFEEWSREGYPNREGKYEFYNVMAIEWVGSVAYRKAIGRVTKESWERVATESVDIVLG